MKWLDLTESVHYWGSEEFYVPYYDPVEKRRRRYYPDFIFRYTDADGLILTEVVEVKPYAQTICPETNPKRKTQAWVRKVETYVTNQAKWDATKKMCAKKGYKFRIITEYDLGFKSRKKRG